MDELSVHGARIVTPKHWFSSCQSCVVEFVDADKGIQPARAAGVIRWAIHSEPDVSTFGIEFEQPLVSVGQSGTP